MGFLNKLLKQTTKPEDVDLLLAESIRDLVKARSGKREEEDEAPRCKYGHICKSFEAEDGSEDEEKKCKKSEGCNDFAKVDEKAEKGKKDVKSFLGDDDSEGAGLDDEYAAKDDKDEAAEKAAASRQKKVAEDAKKSKGKDSIEDTIEDGQQDVYFEDEDDNDLPGGEYDIPDEQGHETGILTNHGRKVATKAKKSRYEEDPFVQVVDLLGNVALLLDQNLKQNDRIAKGMAVMLKSMQKSNTDLELIKSQTPGYPMQPVMFAPAARKKVEGKETYGEEQVRDALVKGMTSGIIDSELVRDFDAFVGRPGVSATEWVKDQLDDNLRKALSL